MSICRKINFRSFRLPLSTVPSFPKLYYCNTSSLQPQVSTFVKSNDASSPHDFRAGVTSRSGARRDVLPAMAYPGAVDPEACQSCAGQHPRHVYAALPGRVLLREKAMHSVQPRVPGRRLSYLLQRHRQLPLLGHPVRLRPALATGQVPTVTLQQPATRRRKMCPFQHLRKEF